MKQTENPRDASTTQYRVADLKNSPTWKPSLSWGASSGQHYALRCPLEAQPDDLRRGVLQTAALQPCDWADEMRQP
jgi:hypothetical protein